MKTLLQTARAKDFGLRNFYKVSDRYSKVTKQDDLLSPKNIIWDDYFDRLEWEVYEAIQPYNYGYVEILIKQLKEAKKTRKGMKTAVNYLMTVINGKTYELNARDIAWRCDYQLSTGYKYATRFYLLHYKKINAMMKRILINFIRENV